MVKQFSDSLIFAAQMAKGINLHAWKSSSRDAEDYLNFWFVNMSNWNQQPVRKQYVASFSFNLDGRYVIAICGTNDAFQGALQLAAWNSDEINENGAISAGMYLDNANFLKAIHFDALKASGLPLTIVAHSAGGSVAICLLELIRYGLATSDLEVVTFGSPAPGNQFLRNSISQYQIVRYQNESDIVPAFPPRGINSNQVFSMYGIDSEEKYAKWVQPQGGIILEETGDMVRANQPRTAFSLKEKQILDWLTDSSSLQGKEHNLETYKRRLEQAAKIAALEEQIANPVKPTDYSKLSVDIPKSEEAKQLVLGFQESITLSPDTVILKNKEKKWASYQTRKKQKRKRLTRIF